MLEQLKRPFKKRYDKVRAYAGNFVGPVKDSASKLFAMFPKIDAFAGSEDQAEASTDGAVVEGAEGAAKPGLKARLKEFKASLKGLSDFQKLILLTIAVVLPAGIFIAVVLAGIFHRHRK